MSNYWKPKKSPKQLRFEAIEWAKWTDTVDCVVLDTESCGGRKEDEIIQIGIVRPQTGEILFNSLVKPSECVYFNKYASAVHGITPDMLHDAPTIQDIWDELYRLLVNNHIIAYNESADRRMLMQTLDNWSIEKPEIEWHCAMKRYKEFSGKTVPLTVACQEMNVKAGNHDAVGDALATARLIYRMKNTIQRLGDYLPGILR
jgi:DNA polymerase-3 subunit epsilon